MEGKKIKIGTYNIANGRDVNWDFKLLAEDIVSNGIDIIGIQEIDRFCIRSKGLNTPELLKEYTGMNYCAYFKCINLGDGEYGTAIFSKYPILETNQTELNDGTKYERRLLTYAKIDVGGSIINFFNTHLTIMDDAMRENEFKIVSKIVNSKENCILVGDFNVVSYDEFEALTPLSRINNRETQYITYPEGERRIDNICFSSEFRPVENGHGIFQKYHSDHVLLYAEFVFVP